MEMFCRGGGAEGQARMLAEGLPAYGFEVELWSYKPPPEDLVPAPLVGAGQRLLSGHELGAPRFVWRLRRELLSRRVSLLHTWMTSASFYGRLAASFCAGLPAICAERTSFKPRREVLADSLLGPLATAYVANSEGVRRAMAARFGVRSRPIHVVPNGVDTVRFSPGEADPRLRARLGIATSARVLGTVGRHIPDKRQEWIIRAVAALKRDGRDVHAILAGWGSEREALSRVAAEQQVADRVHLIGVVEETEVLMRSFDLFVLPSRREGMPNAALEAMACGLPVVATDVAGIKELLGPGTAGPCGEIVAREDEDGFQQAVARYLDDPALRRAAGDRGRRRAETLFSRKAMVHAYAGIYRGVLS